jgi:hypothetical protein
VRVCAHGDAKRAREPKVCELQLVVLLVDQQVLRLEVAVKDAARARGREVGGAAAAVAAGRMAPVRLARAQHSRGGPP